MKRIINIVASLALSFIFVFSLTLSGCKKRANQAPNETSNSVSTSSGGSASSGVTDKKVVDRSDFSFEKLENRYLQMNLHDLAVMAGNGKLTDVAEGYTIGDLVTILFDYCNKSLPEGSNLNAGIGFTLYDDGYWYSNSSGKKIHSVVNRILNFKIDGSEPFSFSEQDLIMWKESKLYTLFGYSEKTMEFVSDVNPLAYALLNSTVSDWYKLLSNFNNDSLFTIKKMCGGVTLYDAFSSTASVSDYLKNYTVSNLIADYATFSALGADALQIELFIESLKSNAVSESGDEEKTGAESKELMKVDGVYYDFSSVVALMDQLEVADSDSVCKAGVLVHIKNVYNALIDQYSVEIEKGVNAYCDTRLTAKFTDEMTVGDALKRFISDLKTVGVNDAVMSILFEYVKYLDFTYGENIVVGNYTVSDLLTYFNKILSTEISSTDSSFTDKLIEKMEPQFKKLVDDYCASHDGSDVTITLAKLLKEGKTVSLTNDDVAFLNSVNGRKLFNSDAVNVTEIAGVNDLLNDIINLSLYDAFIGDALKLDDSSGALNESLKNVTLSSAVAFLKEIRDNLSTAQQSFWFI